MAKLPGHCRYFHDVVTDRIPANFDVKRICQHVLLDHLEGPADPRWEFVPAKARQVRSFLGKLIMFEDRFAGKPMKLLPWQVAIISEFFGWRLKTDHSVRRYLTLRLMLGRKSGKSSLIAGLAIYEGRAGSRGGQVVCAAVNRVQAGVVYKMCERFLRGMDPEVSGEWRQTLRDGITWPERDSSITAASREAKTILGTNPSCAIFDESSILPMDLVEAITTGMGSRTNPITYHITTAAAKRLNMPWYEAQVEWRELLQDKAFRLDRELAFLYAFESEADADDPDAWIKAMPSLGKTVSKEFIRREFARSSNKPAMRRHHLMLYGNLFLDEEAAWMSSDAWAACAAERPDQATLDESPLFLGYDHAVVKAFASLCFLWVLPGGRWWVEWMNWLPELTYDQAREDKSEAYQHLAAGVEEGVLELVSNSATIDEGMIEDVIKGVYAEREVSLGYDPWRSKAMMGRVERKTGVEMVEVQQRPSRLTSPMMALERAILEGELGHGGQSMIAWCMANAHVTNPEMPSRVQHPMNRPERRIDPIAALATAWALMETAQEPGTGLVDLTPDEVEAALNG